jgi:hypothetical protein
MRCTECGKKVGGLFSDGLCFGCHQTNVVVPFGPEGEENPKVERVAKRHARRIGEPVDHEKKARDYIADQQSMEFQVVGYFE